MRERIHKTIAWLMVIGSLIGWPLSLVWFARDEPPVILSLSWMALLYTGATAVFAAGAEANSRSD